nr:tRNA pseudouridine synthase-like 1 [Salvelinus alpinus]
MLTQCLKTTVTTPPGLWYEDVITGVVLLFVSVSVCLCLSLSLQYFKCLLSSCRDIQFWELTFKSRSFLYKQVRRMTGALVAVGQGQMSVSGVKELLEAQDSQAYPHKLTSPPEGLFLTRVEYDRSDLQLYTQEDSQS